MFSELVAFTWLGIERMLPARGYYGFCFMAIIKIMNIFGQVSIGALARGKRSG